MNKWNQTGMKSHGDGGTIIFYEDSSGRFTYGEAKILMTTQKMKSVVSIVI